VLLEDLQEPQAVVQEPMAARDPEARGGDVAADGHPMARGGVSMVC